MFGWLLRLFGGGKSPVLTREMIATLAPAKLCRKVLFSLPDADKANVSQWDFVSVVELDGEVRNGGFNQYYYNSAENRGRAADAFGHIGASDLADLMKRANACFDANGERLAALWGGTMKGFSASYREKFFDAFDSEYYALTEGGRVEALLAEFVRSRAEDFVAQE